MKLLALLWLMGMAGVVSLLGINLPMPENEKLQLPAWGIKVLSIIQPTLLLSLAVWIGGLLAPAVGLSAPFAEAVVKGTSLRLALYPQIWPGLIGGLVGGLGLSALQYWANFFLPAEFVSKAETLSNNTSLLTRFLYGGITEELLLRWGMMTFLVWLGWRILAQGQGEPAEFWFIGAIILSAFLFGLGHLPLAFSLGTPVTFGIMAYVIVGNSFFGLIAGYLYWQYGLEAAMIAHGLVHLVMVTATRLVR